MRIGTAIDYRIRFYFSPESALTCAVARGRWWLESERVDLSKLYEELSRFLDEMPPVRNELADADEERLCRFCWLLGLTDGVGREQDKDSDEFASLWSLRRYGPKRMLDSVEQRVANDLMSMSRLFYGSNRDLIEGFRRADVGGTLAGSSDVEGADFDFALDGCLFDVKTHKVIRRDRVLEALRQLVGYVLLDYNDRYKVRSIGLCFTRHGITRRFNLSEELNCMDDHLAKLRDDFQSCLFKPAA
jgi:hypothetical protein